MSASENRNRLARETSPYLLQHAANPVDWYAWGEEALERARAEDRPILLSVGYAACHWCHVMERESFEDEATAALMNEHFVCIKVDREERPDVDDVYMRAVQMMIGHGGWPLTVFLTPELRPFYGGTYFPPESRMGMPSFRSVLTGVVDAWTARRDELEGVADQLRAQLQHRPADATGGSVDGVLLEKAALELHERFDPNHGGFGRAPKFPNATSVSLLLRHAWRYGDADSLSQADFTLGQMAGGGIRDHLGGGFHRYAVDARWLVPHFEKMLYDNALLATSYLEAHRLTGADEHARTARSTLDWVLREMVTPEGGFASTLDADSEGVEGKYYVWSRAEIDDVLGDDSELFCSVYGATEGGNWEGKNILHLPRPLDIVAAGEEMSEEDLRERLAAGRERLLEARAARVRPGLDDKVLADWNGLMIAALAQAHRSLGESRYLEAAARAAEFVLGPLSPDGRLCHSYRSGRARIPGFLDDHAALLVALVELFRCSFEPRWLEGAQRIAGSMLERFAGDGALYFTGPDHDDLVARPLSGHDGATPSGNGMAVRALAALAHLTGEERYTRAARDIATAFARHLGRAPSGFATLLLGIDELQADPRETVIVGNADSEATRAAMAKLWGRYAPTELVLLLDPDGEQRQALEASLPALQGKADAAPGPGPTFFACRGYTCAAPTDDLEEILAD